MVSRVAKGIAIKITDEPSIANKKTQRPLSAVRFGIFYFPCSRNLGIVACKLHTEVESLDPSSPWIRARRYLETKMSYRVGSQLIERIFSHAGLGWLISSVLGWLKWSGPRCVNDVTGPSPSPLASSRGSKRTSI